MRIPLVDLVAQYEEIAAEVAPRMTAVLEAAAYIGGATVTEFEQAYAEYIGVEHVIGVGNGTDALELALRATGITHGDEVVVPVNSFVATAEAVSRIGAVPVFVDVDPEHLLIDPRLAEKAVTPRTRAIVPVHLFGQTAAVEEISEFADALGIAIIEDAAQSQGASRFERRAGGLGSAAGTSFYPGKNLGAAGDGGAVLTNDAEVAKQVRMLSAHGSDRKYVHDIIGMNSRLDAIQAVVLTAKLRRLDAWNERRREAAERYQALLKDVPGIQLPRPMSGNQDVWHLYVVRVAERDRVLAALHDSGIGAGIHYPTPLHLTGAYAAHGHRRGDFPVAEAAAARMLSLPIHPHITSYEQEIIVEALTTATATS